MEGSQAAVSSDPGVATGGDEVTAFVEAFTEGWRNPVGADSFCDHFDPWLDPEVRLVQPQLPQLIGKRAFRERFARPLFDLIPDIRGIVEGWSARGEVIYIELRLEGTVGQRRFELHSCDRITLRDGRAIERVAYLDAAPLLKAVLLSPRAWPRFARIQLADRRRGGAG